jgi:uncharacterized protein (TIGR03066 family)
MEVDFADKGEFVRALAILPSMAVAFVLIGAGSAQEKGATNKEKIVGTWEMVKTTWKEPKNFVDQGIQIEFAKDGKWFFTDSKIRKDGKKGGPAPYTVDGDTIKVNVFGKTDSWKIKTLSDKALIVEEPSLGNGGEVNTSEFKRIK